jgi:hypothetical protein
MKARILVIATIVITQVIGVTLDWLAWHHTLTWKYFGDYLARSAYQAAVPSYLLVGALQKLASRKCIYTTVTAGVVFSLWACFESWQSRGIWPECPDPRLVAIAGFLMVVTYSVAGCIAAALIVCSVMRMLKGSSAPRSLQCWIVLLSLPVAVAHCWGLTEALWRDLSRQHYQLPEALPLLLLATPYQFGCIWLDTLAPPALIVLCVELWRARWRPER